MPSFSFEQWKSWIQPGQWKSKEFEDVYRYAKIFLNDPTEDNAWNLRQSLNSWKRTKADWKSSVRNQTTAHYGRAMERLTNEVDLSINARAVGALRAEATRLHNQFGEIMPAEYRRKLTEVFIHPDPPVQNFTWHKHAAHFEASYHNVPGAALYPTEGVTAFTITLAGRHAGYPNLNDPGHEPGNRVIELRHDFTDSTACHELFHWVTHAHYETASEQYSGDNVRTIIEGVTEFFTRRIRSDRDATNYRDEVGRVYNALKDDFISERALTLAYFTGVNAKPVMDGIVAALERGRPR